MPDTIRQQLVNQIKLRLAAISVGNGYQTNLGARPIQEWPVAFQENECPALGVCDLVSKGTQQYPHEKRINNVLPLQVRIFLKRGTTPEEARTMIADVMQAIVTDPITGTPDPRFGGLAVDTKPDEDGFVVPTDTFQIDGAAVTFTVEFLSAPFNAYQ